MRTFIKSQAWALQWEREHNQIVPSRHWMHTLADAARRGDHVALRAALTDEGSDVFAQGR